MQATSPAPLFFRFGVFELDGSGTELRREGRTLHLQPQPLQVLLRLVSEPGKIVSRVELQQCLWNDDTFVGYEDGVNHAINKIREALNDSAHNPRFVETVPRLGYRFIAPVGNSAEAKLKGKLPLGPATDVAAPKRNWLRRHWRIGVVFAGIITFAIVLLKVNDWHAAHKPIGSIAVLPMSNFSADEPPDLLADAVTSEVIAQLSRVKTLRVVSHTSVLRFKGSTKSLHEIGRELHVDAVVEGSVMTSGDSVRVAIKLIRVADEWQIWAEVYQTKRDDVLALADQLVNDIISEGQIKRPPRNSHDR